MKRNMIPWHIVLAVPWSYELQILNAELRDISVETLVNALEDCNYTKGDKLVEALLMAKILAEKIGGKAILELI